MQVLLVEPPGASLPEGTATLIRDIGWHSKSAADFRSAICAAGRPDIEAVIFAEPPRDADRAQRDDYDEFLELVNARRLAAVMIGDRAPAAAENPRVDVVDRRIPLAELRGRLAMVERYHGQLRRVEDELRTMEGLSKKLGHHFRELDEEFRLAARLQRDFLPKLVEPFGLLRFSAIFRPASWVSGDIYDVFRIDDEHTGMYLVDAVGHGMAASLLTMFIKRAIVSTGEGGAVLPPSRVLAVLNDALAEQALPQCQFVTACYAVFHQPSGVLSYARGGHPYPFLFPREGSIRELDAPGGLLGIAKGETFENGQVRLAPGEKVVFYSDGVELALHAEKSGATAVREAFAETATQPFERMFGQLQDRLDVGLRTVDPADDVTVLGFVLQD